jgi:hypothetical protein
MIRRTFGAAAETPETSAPNRNATRNFRFWSMNSRIAKGIAFHVID